MLPELAEFGPKLAQLGTLGRVLATLGPRCSPRIGGLNSLARIPAMLAALRANAAEFGQTGAISCIRNILPRSAKFDKLNHSAQIWPRSAQIGANVGGPEIGWIRPGVGHALPISAEVGCVFVQPCEIVSEVDPNLETPEFGRSAGRICRPNPAENNASFVSVSADIGPDLVGTGSDSAEIDANLADTGANLAEIGPRIRSPKLAESSRVWPTSEPQENALRSATWLRSVWEDWSGDIPDLPAAGGFPRGRACVLAPMDAAGSKLRGGTFGPAGVRIPAELPPDRDQVTAAPPDRQCHALSPATAPPPPGLACADVPHREERVLRRT